MTIDLSQIILYSPQGHSGPHGFEPDVFAGGPAALAAKIARYEPEKWGGCYVELGRDPTGAFSNVCWHDAEWDEQFALAMRPVITKFNGTRIAYLGIADGDLRLPFKLAMAKWYETMQTLSIAGFKFVGIDASADATTLDAYCQGADYYGLRVLAEGAPRELSLYSAGFIQTTEVYRAPLNGHYTPEKADADGHLAIIIDNGWPHDQDVTKEQWSDPAMRPRLLEHFVATVRGAGGWPALVPWDPALRVNAALPETPQ